MEVSNKIQSLYDDIKSSNTNDEIDQLIYLLTKNENESVNSNCSFEIRILSSNEYNKYLINATLNGSIVAHNNSVWNELTPHTYYLILNPSHSPYTVDGVNRAMSASMPFGNTTGFTLISCKWDDSTIYTHDINFNIELLSDNSSLNNVISGRNNHNRLCLCFAHSGIRAGDIFSPNLTNKQLTHYTSPLLSTNVNSSGLIYKRYFRLPLAFRPVFQYIDNRKSKNIFT